MIARAMRILAINADKIPRRMMKPCSDRRDRVLLLITKSNPALMILKSNNGRSLANTTNASIKSELSVVGCSPFVSRL